ncbi:MAG TPA: SDR family NAD(P)-dependent oxidoreductase [Gaiellaceae bacterium]
MSTDHDTGRVAVITGASSGIGEATARAMAADGHRVALLARRADRIDALADELGNGAIAIEADVTDRDSLVAAAERVQQELGGADILVNNAGVMLTAPFTSDQSEEHRRMVETNLLGAMAATEVFLDQLRANGGGDLVNVSSVAGRVAPAGFAAYAATKWGINGWSEALRVELQPDIRVIVIEPGATASELSDHITHADSKRVSKEALDWSIPPEDIADVIAFAVSRSRRCAAIADAAGSARVTAWGAQTRSSLRRRRFSRRD